MNTAMTTMAFVCAVAATCAQAQFAPTGKFPAQPVTGQPASIDPFQTTPANPVKTWGELLGLPQTKPNNSGAGQGGGKKPLRINERPVDPEQYEGIANKNSPEALPPSSLRRTKGTGVEFFPQLADKNINKNKYLHNTPF